MAKKKGKSKEAAKKPRDSHHHINPCSRGGETTEKDNLIVFQGDIGLSNRPVIHPSLHKVDFNKTLLEQVVRDAILRDAHGELNVRLFLGLDESQEIDGNHPKLNALEQLTGERYPRPRRLLERRVELYGRTRMRRHIRRQLVGRDTDALLVRFSEYDAYLLGERETIGDSPLLLTRSRVRLSNRNWGYLWSDDALYEVFGFRLAQLEDRNGDLQQKLITRVCGGTRQFMCDAYSRVTLERRYGDGDSLPPPSLFAECIQAFYGNEMIVDSREFVLAGRSYEELVEDIDDALTYVMAEKHFR